MSMIRRRVFCDVQDGREKIVIHQVQDVDDIKRINRATFNANGSGTSSRWQGREWVKVASIPLVLLDQWAQKGLNFYDPNNWPILKRLLNDSEYESLRTAPGRF